MTDEIQLIWPDDEAEALKQATSNAEEFHHETRADPAVVDALESMIAARKAGLRPPGARPSPLLAAEAFEIRLLENGRNWIKTMNDLAGLKAHLRARHEATSLRQQRRFEALAKLSGARFIGSWFLRMPRDGGRRGWEAAAAADGYIVQGERHPRDDRHQSQTGNQGFHDLLGHGPYESRAPTGSDGRKPSKAEIDDDVDLSELRKFFRETKNRKLRAAAKESVAAAMILRNPKRSDQQIAFAILAALGPDRSSVSGSFRRTVGLIREALTGGGFVDTPG